MSVQCWFSIRRCEEVTVVDNQWFGNYLSPHETCRSLNLILET